MSELRDEMRVVDPATIDKALDVLLGKNPDAVLLTVNALGLAVEMPAEATELHKFGTLPVEIGRGSLLDVTVPSDKTVVISTWQRALQNGMAIGSIRTTNVPDHFVTVTFFDVRPRWGVLLSVITDDQDAVDSVDSGAAHFAGALLPPLRPRSATVRKNMIAVITEVDDRVTQMLGWEKDQLLGFRSSEFIHPDDQDRAISNWMELLAQRSPQRVRLRHRRSDGSWVWVEIENIPLDVPGDPEALDVVAHMRDVTDEMESYEALHRREQQIRQLAEALPAGIFQVDPDGSVVYATKRLRAILGVQGGPTLKDQVATMGGADQEAVLAAFDGVLADGREREVEVGVRLPDGERRRCAVTLVGLRDAGEAVHGTLVSVSDITESARLREELQERATYDALTGCYNRASVITLLENALTTPAPGVVAVIFVDLDKFKPINDELGHAAGDEILRRTAAVLKGVLRDGDIVGRIGGDEFLLVCRGLSGTDEALAVAARVGEGLNHRMDLAEGTVELGASIGVAVAGEETTADRLVADADAAMYESKRLGHGEPVLFTPGGTA